MDLSFTRFERDVTVTMLPTDLAVLMVGVAARQAASPTALAQAALTQRAIAPAWLEPESGAFSAPVAVLLRGWKGP